MSTALRKSIPLDDSLAALMSAIRVPGSPERAAVESLAGPLPRKTTEAAALNTILSLGSSVIADAMSYDSYLAEAADFDRESIEHDQWSRNRRTRTDREAWGK